MHGLFYGACLLLGIKIGNGFANHKISQHFFFFTKHFLLEKEPVLRKQNSFGKAFLFKKRFVLKEKQIGFLVWSYKQKIVACIYIMTESFK